MPANPYIPIAEWHDRATATRLMEALGYESSMSAETSQDVQKVMRGLNRTIKQNLHQMGIAITDSEVHFTLDAASKRIVLMVDKSFQPDRALLDKHIAQAKQQKLQEWEGLNIEAKLMRAMQTVNAEHPELPPVSRAYGFLSTPQTLEADTAKIRTAFGSLFKNPDDLKIAVDDHADVESGHPVGLYHNEVRLLMQLPEDLESALNHALVKEKGMSPVSYDWIERKERHAALIGSNHSYAKPQYRTR
jgi:hypothetical protein